jgi:hypothetical protein
VSDDINPSLKALTDYRSNLQTKVDSGDLASRRAASLFTTIGISVAALGACRSMHVDRFGAECFDDTRRDEGATP